MSISKTAPLDVLSHFQSVFQHASGDDVAALVLIAAASALFTLRGTLWDSKDPYHHLWYEKPQAADVSSRKVETRNVAKKLEETNKSVVIFWGSQSGTAEGLANRLARDAHRRFGLDILVADLQDYDPDSISEIPESKLAIFIISTYGEGDPSDNTTPLYTWLNTPGQTAPFKDLRYVAFGLGNSKYKFYNKVIDTVVTALNAYNAQALLPTGRGDDAEGTTEEDFMEWKESLFKLLKEHLGCKERPEVYEPTLRVVEDTSLESIDLHTGDPIPPKDGKKSVASNSLIRPLHIKSIKKLLDSSDRNCLHAELDISEFPELKYRTGDHLAVWPVNPIEEADRLIKALGLEEMRSIPLLISSIEPGSQCKIPSPTTVQALFQYYLEICAPVARETILLLAGLATSPAAKKFLVELGSDKGTYGKFCLENHVTFGRLLEKIAKTCAETWNLPLSFVLENIPLLTPRKYSISSSAITHPKLISLTISTTTPATTTIPIFIPGLTTSYLTSVCDGLTSISLPSIPADSQQDLKLHASIRPSKFHLPVLASTPLILIASGSGIAPFRAFLHERARLASIGKPSGKTILLFGCRSKSDYLYTTEFTELTSQLPNLKIITAFSREHRNRDGGRMYVQDRLEENMTEVLHAVLEMGAHVYLCGSAAMARDVNAVFGRGVRGVRGWGDGELREWCELAKKRGKWLEDVWG